MILAGKVVIGIISAILAYLCLSGRMMSPWEEISVVQGLRDLAGLFGGCICFLVMIKAEL